MIKNPIFIVGKFFLLPHAINQFFPRLVKPDKRLPPPDREIDQKSVRQKIGINNRFFPYGTFSSIFVQ